MWWSVEETNIMQYDMENDPEWQRIVRGDRAKKIKKLTSRRKNVPSAKQITEMYEDYLKKVFQNA